jgi:[acyl-carrier-protein] S-malonyltransferase
MSIAFCYPGQGVQHVGMAEGFVKADSAYADMVAKASEASGIDMNKLLFAFTFKNVSLHKFGIYFP